MEHVKAMLQKSSGKLKGKIVDNHVVLDITGDAVHYWSPQLSFRIEPDFSHEHSSVISGIIGPRPAVWTLFSFIYFLSGRSIFSSVLTVLQK
ncbi:MAG: hypothetical protein ACI9V1_002010 [Spirosomataceae bacterium]|jgi:hypothetical protein